MNENPETRQNGRSKMNEVYMIWVNPTMLPGRNTMFLRSRNKNRVTPGSTATKANKREMKLSLALSLLKYFPRNEPAPVMIIQLARMIPITSSFP